MEKETEEKVEEVKLEPKGPRVFGTLKKFVLVAISGVAGLLLILAGLGLIQLSLQLILYAGIGLLVLAVLLYFLN